MQRHWVAPSLVFLLGCRPPAAAGLDASVADAASPPPPEAGAETPAPTCDDALPKGAAPSWQACSVPYGCVLRPRTCCASCALDRCLLAVATPHEPDLTALLCEPTGFAGCPACASPVDHDQHAACRAGRCVTVHVSTDPESACDADADCVARAAECCPPCGPGAPWVALHKDMVATYAMEVCGKTKCAHCPTPPPPPKTRCDPATKHCVVAP